MTRLTRLVFMLLLTAMLAISGCDASTGSHRAPATTMKLPDFTSLVKANEASVVNISTTQKVKVKRHHGKSGAMGNMLRHLFGDRLGRQLERRWKQQHGDQAPSLPRAQPHTRNIRSLGSGFVLSKDGYILTNYHVVKDADSIMVRLNDRRELDATLVGKDAQSDLALLKVKADDLQPVTIGSSHNLQVGQWVLAIGAPFGFDSSVTAGIVSAKSRSLPHSNYVPFIQTDVPINPGNSGGPLFNLQGQVVGINSQIVSRSGGFMGLSFAVPIDLAMNVVKQLKAGKTVSRGWLGVMIQNVSHDLAESFGLDRAMGALVARIMPDSPAAKAGLKVGDVIVSFNGTSVNTSGELPPLVGTLPPGAKAKVVVVRDGKHKTLTVTLGKLPAKYASTSAKNGSGKPAHLLGLDVASLNDADQDKVDHGVRVVQSHGAAANAGISRGDIIESVNNKPVKSVGDFKRLVKKYKNDGKLVLLVYHNGNAGFVVVHMDSDAD